MTERPNRPELVASWPDVEAAGGLVRALIDLRAALAAARMWAAQVRGIPPALHVALMAADRQLQAAYTVACDHWHEFALSAFFGDQDEFDGPHAADALTPDPLERPGTRQQEL